MLAEANRIWHLVRLQTYCVSENLLGSTVCFCKATIDASFAEISRAKYGALIYLHYDQQTFSTDPGGGISQLLLHNREREPQDAVSGKHQERLLRQTGLGGQILSDLGIRKIKAISYRATRVRLYKVSASRSSTRSVLRLRESV